ncbi:hypothetical protein [Flavobacterium sp. NRK1]|uniref:hypothetical protein n=1 Tax=Flavobacterium sp. NRK1 TaxID=2954929 RepID=UPI002092CEB9|nr:hypothetical protein [Flavobacterium sp. NRK1]MCO6148929.1 hypothetical protein [Flavobacterium sp. NRK1]
MRLKDILRKILPRSRWDGSRGLNSCYLAIANYKGNIEICPAWWHLKEFYQDMLRLSTAQDAENRERVA